MNRGHYERGVDGAEVGVSESEGVEIAGVEALQDDVGVLGQSSEEASAFGFGYVEGYAALGGVERPEVEAGVGVWDVGAEGADGAGGISGGRLNLDDAGAHVAEELADELALFVAEVEDGDVGEGGMVGGQ